MDKSEEKFINTELDNIFTKLHQADDRISKDREETLRLATETRTMLTDLRKHFG